MGLLQRDYLVDQLVRFADAIRMSIEKSRGNEDDGQTAIELLETQIGESVNIDGAALLSLTPDSVSSILRVSGTEPGLAEYIVQSLLLESTMLDNADLAALRRDQAFTIAQDYGIDMSGEPLSAEELEQFFEDTLAQARAWEEGSD